MLLEVEGLFKSFGGLMAINNLSFHIEEGESVGLIGPNGSGKSTVFNVVTGFLKADSGKIAFEGKNITRLAPHRISRLGMGRTFQLAKPFLHLTTLQTVMAARAYGHSPAPRLAAAEEDAREILSLIGLADKEGAPVKDLTAVQRKQLELGRALAGRPRLLLLDEFMAGLNPVEAQTAVTLLKEIRGMGITMVVVEHIVKAVLELSDRVIVLGAGSKIAEGSPSEIVANPHVVAAYLGSAYARS